VGEFVVNVTVALRGPGVAVAGGSNVSVKFALPPAPMLLADGGAIVNSDAFGPEIATLVMFSGCDSGALLITIGAVVEAGAPPMLASAGTAQLPPAGVVTDGVGGVRHRFGSGGAMSSVVALEHPFVTLLNTNGTSVEPNRVPGRLPAVVMHDSVGNVKPLSGTFIWKG
jgi:hypothetical protein